MVEGFTYQEVTDEMIVDVAPSFDAVNSNARKSLYIFDCQITLHNVGERPLFLRNGHWIIRKGPKQNNYLTLPEDLLISPFEAVGRATSIKKSFRLDVGHASIRGKLEFQEENGTRIWVPIPLCFLRMKNTHNEGSFTLWT